MYCIFMRRLTVGYRQQPSTRYFRIFMRIHPNPGRSRGRNIVFQSRKDSQRKCCLPDSVKAQESRHSPLYTGPKTYMREIRVTARISRCRISRRGSAPRYSSIWYQIFTRKHTKDLTTAFKTGFQPRIPFTELRKMSCTE